MAVRGLFRRSRDACVRRAASRRRRAPPASRWGAHSTTPARSARAITQLAGVRIVPTRRDERGCGRASDARAAMHQHRSGARPSIEKRDQLACVIVRRQASARRSPRECRESASCRCRPRNALPSSGKCEIGIEHADRRAPARAPRRPAQPATTGTRESSSRAADAPHHPARARLRSSRSCLTATITAPGSMARAATAISRSSLGPFTRYAAPAASRSRK